MSQPSREAVEVTAALEKAKCPHTEADYCGIDCCHCIARALDAFASKAQAPPAGVGEAVDGRVYCGAPDCDRGVVYRTGRGGAHGGCPAPCPGCVYMHSNGTGESERLSPPAPDAVAKAAKALLGCNSRAPIGENESFEWVAVSAEHLEALHAALIAAEARQGGEG